MARGKYFKLAARLVHNGTSTFVKGQEYESANFSEDLLDVLDRTSYAKGDTFAKAVVFYDTSEVKTTKGKAEVI